MSKMIRIPTTAMVISVLALSLVSVASAQTLDGYNDAGPRITNQFQGEDPADAAGASTDPVTLSSSEESGTDASSLPFTGLDLGLIAGAGGLLLALGVGMRRIVRGAPESV